MNAQLASEAHEPGVAADSARALLRSVVIADLCDSTALVDRLGDSRAAELIRAHDRLLRALIREHSGQEIDKTDGFLSLFERPIEAVGFALAYQRGLRAFSLEHGVELKARVGVHVGEVMTWQNEAEDVAKGAKPTEVEGLAKPVAARLMGLALPGQILLSGVAYSLAHRAEGELGAALARVQWKPHGLFRFKGVAEAVPVYEIGEAGIAPFKSPAWSGKAHREVPLWRRPLVLGFEVLALLALIALPAWYFLKPEPAIAFAERDWVVLADLRNLTGDPRFDDSLGQAFRIGLEQSRHVNVLSRLRAREALELMQRDPDSTAIDREVGAELAIREGARAVLVPTLAEVGGRLRFTAEVVDPHSQTTLLASAADGDNLQALLSSVDEVNRELRVGLGEALEAVRRDSVPLARAATADLDALRAYSLALDASVQNRGEEALALAKQALSIDPEFAHAHLLIGLVLRNAGDRTGAIEAYRSAQSLGERLSVRSRLLVDAVLAEMIATPRDLLERWRTLTQLYPDEHAAQTTLGYFAWTLAQDVRGAEAAYRTSVNSPQSPDRGVALYGLGGVLLAQDQREEALAAFRGYAETRRRFENQLYAAAYAAGRDFDAAQRTLAAGARSGVGGRSLSQLGFLAVLDIDQGLFDRAFQRLSEAEEQANALGPRQRLMVQAWQLSLTALLEEPEQARRKLESAVERLEQVGDERDPVIGVDRIRHRLLLAQWLAQLDADAARRALEGVPDSFVAGGYPELSQRALLARSVLQCREGEYVAPLEEMQQLLASGNALFSANEALLYCLKRAGDVQGALEVARNASLQRGAAYAEIAGDYALWPRNLLMSTLYLAEIAELAGPASDEGKQVMAELAQRWPTGQVPQRIRDRLALLNITQREQPEATEHTTAPEATDAKMRADSPL